MAPRSFFVSFPGAGHRWVAPLGAYNEHLTRDVGGLYLALCVVSAWPVLRPNGELFAVAGVAWLAFGVPHLLFHVAHLGVFSRVDAVGTVVVIGATVALAVVLVIPWQHTAHRTREGGK